ncbi:hypothetical protein [Hugenholtzia roseola]|uniref:hypothetical protein n=1 Tax=Hugenholtzia roseola TaxID=1002 RepID=UPI0003F87F9E|nr:hypothetical protein [Hugenholtzia roseola]
MFVSNFSDSRNRSKIKISFWAFSFVFLFALSGCGNAKKTTEGAELQTQTEQDTTSTESSPESSTENTSQAIAVGEFVATQYSENTWYLAQVQEIAQQVATLRYMDNDTGTKPLAELLRLSDTLTFQENEKIYALFGDGVRFKEATVKGVEGDSVLVSFEGFNDEKVAISRTFKK